MNTLVTPIRLYYKSELALLYDPEGEPATAMHKLRRMMLADPVLMRLLKETGYQARNRYLTPKQVELVFEHLGRP